MLKIRGKIGATRCASEYVQIGCGDAVERLQHLDRDAFLRQRIVHRVECQFGRVVLLTEVAEKYVRERRRPVVGEESGGVVVAQMAGVTAHALFQRVGIASVFQHHVVVVGFDDQIVGLGDVVGHLFADETEVGGNDERFAFVGEGVAHAVGGVVADGERLYGEVANGDVFAFFVVFLARREFFGNAVVAIDADVHFACGIDGDVVFFAQHTHRADVVGVVVGDENAPNLFEREVVFFQFAFHGAHAHAGIDQEAVFARTDIIAIAATAAAHAQKAQFFCFRIHIVCVPPQKVQNEFAKLQKKEIDSKKYFYMRFFH